MAQGIIEKAKKLPEDLRKTFFGDEPMHVAEKSCFLYGVSDANIRFVTLPLGRIFVRELPLSEYPKEIAMKAGIDMEVAYGIAYEVNRRIFLKFPEYFKDAEALQREWEGKKKPPVISEEEAKKKLYELEPWLLVKEEEAAEEAKKIAATRDRLPLVQALGKYPRLGEQMISAGRLSLKGRSEPARGNLSNWLRVYRDELGVGYHDPVMRAKFLFNSANTRNISSEERERLNVILRSVEENSPIDIDIVKFEIAFPVFRITEPKSAPVVAPKAPAPQLRGPGSASPAPAPKRQGFSTFSENPIDRKAAGAQGGLRINRGIQFSGFSPKPKPGTGQLPEQGASIRPERPSERLVSPAKAAAPPDLPTGSFSFSSNHSLPSEREDSVPKPVVAPPVSRPAPSTPLRKPEPVPSPFVIHPMSRKETDDSQGSAVRNVVDLRE